MDCLKLLSLMPIALPTQRVPLQPGRLQVGAKKSLDPFSCLSLTSHF